LENCAKKWAQRIKGADYRPLKAPPPPINPPKNPTQQSPLNHKASRSPAILVPGLHLAVAQLQLVGQLHAILDTEVLLPLEGLLQRLQLMVGEGGTRLPLLLAQTQAQMRRGVAVRRAAVLQAVVAVVVLAAWK